MRKTTKTKPRTKKLIEEVAEKAANDALLELEQEIEESKLEELPDLSDMYAADEVFQQSSPEEVSAKDVFRDAWLKAQTKNDTPQFYIYKNGTWIANRPYPYSWEKLQGEYGAGHYRIVAKSTINGQNLMIQSQLVGDPNEYTGQKEEIETEVDPVQSNPFAFLTAMSQVQERAETKAAQIASQQTALVTQMMQAMFQAQAQAQVQQAQAQQQFQMMLMEMQKQNQAVAAENNKLVIGLLTQKPQTVPDTGIKPAEMLKLLQEERKAAKEEAKNNYELIDRKAEALAEIKAEALAGTSDEDESLTKTIIKGVVPVFAEAIKKGSIGVQGIQPGSVPQAQVPQLPRLPVQPKTDYNRANVQTTKPVGVDPAALLRERKAAQAQEEKKKSQLAILDIIGVDLVQALVDRRPAKDVTPDILNKLEKSGTSRQTVSKLFELNDFYVHARRLGVPTEADAWLKEFYEEIQHLARTASNDGASAAIRDVTPPVRTRPTSDREVTKSI